MLYRQGDLLIERVEAVPPDARRRKRLILAAGAATGQRHQVRDGRGASLFEATTRRGRELFLEVVADEVGVVHPEHGEITLPQGVYRVWPQREFNGVGWHTVYD